MELRDVIAKLASGYRIRSESDGFHGYEYTLAGDSYSVDGLMAQLVREGWLTSTPNGAAYVLSDAGLKAYMRSTDEMGDGKLTAPSREP